MLKINNFPKKILKVSILIFTVMISSFIFSNNVSAKVNTIWTGRGDGVIQGTFTSEHLKKIIQYNDLDYETYDSFTIYDNSGYWNIYYKNNFGIYFYNSDDYNKGRVKFTQEGNNGTVYYSGYGKGIYHLEIYNSDRKDFYDMMNFDWYNYEQPLTYISGSYTSWRSVNIYEHFPVSGLISDYVDLTELKTNKLDIEVDTNEIRSIRLDFILPSTNIDSSLDFSYRVEPDELFVPLGQYFNSPYFTSSEIRCSTDETGASSCAPFPKNYDWYIDYNYDNFLFDTYRELDSNYYERKFKAYTVTDFSYPLFTTSNSVNSISLFFDFETINNENMLLFFESNLDFTVTYNYKNTSDVINDPFLEDYYGRVNLKGKYAVAFLPQTNLDDSYTGYRTLFKATDTVDIQLRDTFDVSEYNILSAYSLNYCNEFLSNQNKIPYSCNNMNGVFDFYIHQDINEQTLFFINKKYEDNSDLVIIYDTRYYSYVVLDSPDSTGTVVRPGEDEETTIIVEYFYNYYDKYKNYELEHSFNSFLKPIEFIFTSINNFYNTYCPLVFKHFLIISFTFVVSLILIKLFL